MSESEDPDQAEFGALCRAIVATHEAGDAAAERAAQAELDAVVARRAAEANAEREEFIEALGGSEVPFLVRGPAFCAGPYRASSSETREAAARNVLAAVASLPLRPGGPRSRPGRGCRMTPGCLLLHRISVITEM